MKPNLRRCISCRKIAPKSEFWRIVKIFDSSKIQLEQGMGRGAYLCPRPECLHLAQKKNLISRSLKIQVGETLYQELWHKLNH